MFETSPDGRPAGISPAAARQCADNWETLIGMIQELVSRLGQVRDGDPFKGGIAESRRWEGGGFIYMEIDLDPAAEAEIDLNVHDGRVVVRIASTRALAGAHRDRSLAGAVEEETR